MKLVLKVSGDDVVVATLRYRQSSPKTYKGRADGQGVYVRSFTVVKNAPLGRGSVLVAVFVTSRPPLEDTLPFTVTK